uniref:Turripeptide OL55-like n=1 Tax=Iotyrris cingulifera TaxID=553733 RepID=TU55_IOTCI|nr:RecName: Full=Turripeptide OL55-like [Iotyrris cingulifera]
LHDPCDNTEDCEDGLECNRNKCLIPYDSDKTCETGWDCVHGVWCSSFPGGSPGCRMDYRCKNEQCEDPATECVDEICGRKEGERCIGPCKAGLTCRNGYCRKPW